MSFCYCLLCVFLMRCRRPVSDQGSEWSSRFSRERWRSEASSRPINDPNLIIVDAAVKTWGEGEGEGGSGRQTRGDASRTSRSKGDQFPEFSARSSPHVTRNPRRTEVCIVSRTRRGHFINKPCKKKKVRH